MDKRIIGHRGARGLWPENSRTGFRNAVGLRLHGIEFDVHPTRDGDLAVIHDPTLGRTTDGAGPVQERSMAELRALRLRGADEGVPSLDDVLGIVTDSGMELHIELKADAQQRPYPGLERQVAAQVARRGLGARTVLTSFWLEVLEQLRAACPDGRLLASLDESSVAKQGGLDAMLDRLDALRVEIVAVHKDLLAREMPVLLRRVRAERLCAWVINEPDEVAQWLRSEVGTITSDRPDRFPGVLGGA